ncbi:hypothetical protein KP509_03G068800 [Ceratopteris richardii]|uniref:NADH dehydrogenase [ubiquinone] 1 alpha subcomplex subunit 12 n=1 Tax=Ceratopteris richardii TaxID=49495 RepID=A0A8T2V8N0_CERRI|nr:hypothetical protein KP509_03G068800 [Ceratopteris richardii]
MEFLRSALKAVKSFSLPKGFLTTLRDGNLMETTLHGRGATLVGVDKFGNKYYEKLENVQYGRHRWVEYADIKNYDASSVPPEWHGWLHYVTDHTPEQLEELKPVRYGMEHRRNQSGLGDQYSYFSKGHAKKIQAKETGQDMKHGILHEFF